MGLPGQGNRILRKPIENPQEIGAIPASLEPSGVNPDARGKSSWGHRMMWDEKTHEYRKMGVLALPVRHAEYAGPLWLVVGRTGKEPWYLITNQRIETEEQAWEIISIYAMRWRIEMSFRYGKSELAMESVRVKDWEVREKLLLLVTLAYSYLLSL